MNVPKCQNNTRVFCVSRKICEVVDIAVVNVASRDGLFLDERG